MILQQSNFLLLFLLCFPLLSADSPLCFTPHLLLSDVTCATDNADENAVVSIAVAPSSAIESTETITITVTNDLLVEGDETVIITIEPATP